MSGRSTYLPAPTRNRCRIPRADRRGLGLLDVMLAVIVLSVAALWGGQIVGTWVRDQVVANEVRATAALARAGRLLVEGNVNHRIRSPGMGTAAPLEVTFGELKDADLRSSVAGTRTPARRNLTLWLWRETDDRVLVIARARGEIPLPGTPGAEAGVTNVGTILPGETRLRGPGVEFDMDLIPPPEADFVEPGDLFAFDHVWLDAACGIYLMRLSDGETGCAGGTRMQTDLDMGGFNLINAGRIEAENVVIRRLDGDTTVTGALTVDGDLGVTGEARLNTLTVADRAGFSEGLNVRGTLTVNRDLTVGNTLTAGDLSFDGTLTVAGEARLGDAEAVEIVTQTLSVTDTLTADSLDVSKQIFGDVVTVSRCRGCAP